MSWQKMTSLEPISRYGPKQVFFSASGFALTKENVYQTDTFASRNIEALGEAKLTVPLGGIMRDYVCTQDYKLSLPE